MSVDRYRPYRPLLPASTPSSLVLVARLMLAVTLGLAVAQTDPVMLGVLAGAATFQLRER